MGGRALARLAFGSLLALVIGLAPVGRALAQERAWAAGPHSSEWSMDLLPDLPDPLGFGGPLVGIHGGALVVAGGANFPVPLSEGGEKVWHDRVFVLPLGEEAWREVGRLPRPLAYAACASGPRGIAVAGGSDASAVHAQCFLISWDGERVVFDSLPDLPQPSAFGSAEAIGSRVFVLGGKRAKDESQLAGAFWTLDLDHTELGWEELPTHPAPARLKMVTAIQQGPGGEECLFVFSGSVTSRAVDGVARYRMLTDCHRYSPSEREWTTIASLPVLEDSRDLPGAAAFAQDPWPINAACAAGWGTRQILTFGGTTGRYILGPDGEPRAPSLHPSFLNRVLSYDAQADRWRIAGTMPVGVVTTEAVRWGDSIVVPSGEVRPGVRTPRVQILSPAAPVSFGALDYTVLGLYLALMVGVGWFFASRGKTTEDFFLAGRRIPWWAAGLSVFGTQLSAITFMAVPATSFGSDWRRFAGSLMLLPVLLVVITCFVPLFRRLEITTAYEYLEARFDSLVRKLASGTFILFQFGRMGIVLLLPAIALSAVTDMSPQLCILLMGVLATAYTVMGGIAAVIWTDVLQVVVLIGGALVCLVIAVHDSGGVSAALETARAADKFHMFDWTWSTTDMVGWVLIVGFAFTNLVPYTTDQTVIQRYLTTSDEAAARKSLWLNLAMTIPTGLLFYGLGTALFVYYQGHPAESAMLPAKPDQLVPWFVVSHLPAGVAGAVVAGIFAASMSSLDSSMNSVSAAVMNDFLGRGGRGSESTADLRLARGLTLGLGVLGTLAALLLASFEIRFLFDFFQRVLGLCGGGVAGVFALAVFAPRCNATGALAGLLSGAAATLAVAFLTETHFLLFAAVGSVSCFVVGLVVSACTGGEQRDLSGLTLATLDRTGGPRG